MGHRGTSWGNLAFGLSAVLNVLASQLREHSSRTHNCVTNPVILTRKNSFHHLQAGGPFSWMTLINGNLSPGIDPSAILRASMAVVSVCLGCYHKNTIVWVAYRQREFISYNFGDISQFITFCCWPPPPPQICVLTCKVYSFHPISPQSLNLLQQQL